MRSRFARILIVLATAALIAPTPAVADAAVPAIVVVYPGMIVLLIPIIAIEAFVFVRRLGTTPRRGLVVSVSANAASTLVGVPVTGALVAALAILPESFGPTPDPYPVWLFHLTSIGWLINSGMRDVVLGVGILFVPFFFMSWWIEYLVARRMMRDSEPRKVSRAVLVANLWSYALIAAVLLPWSATVMGEG